MVVGANEYSLLSGLHICFPEDEIERHTIRLQEYVLELTVLVTQFPTDMRARLVDDLSFGGSSSLNDSGSKGWLGHQD